MEPYKIERVSPAERLEELVDIWESAVRATHHFLTEENITRFRNEVRRALPGMDTVLAAVGQDGAAVAFLACAAQKIEMLFVHSDCRGGGVGRELVLECVHSYGGKYVDVNEQNEQGVGFYRHLGFRETGRSPLDGMGNPFPLLHMIYEPNASK